MFETFWTVVLHLSFPKEILDPLVVQTVKNVPAVWGTRVRSLG